MKLRFLTVLFLAALLPLAAQSQRSNKLLIYSLDVEGGQSTLLVGPSGESLLIDTGWPGNDARDARRIEAAMKDAGIHKLDHVLITHFHTDHVGGVPNLIQLEKTGQIEVGELIDHGENREDSDITRRDYAAYLKAIEGHKRRIVKPGDTINIPGLDVRVLTADGEHIASIPGVKPEVNSACAGEPKWELEASENARSVGILVRYGNFRFLDMGDLTKAKEIPLVCPMNLIGSVDLFLVTHHGMDWSNAAAFVQAIAPRAAIMPNGAHKAGKPEAWQTVHESPGLQDLYMLHTAESNDAHNSAEPLIANPKGNTHDGYYFKVEAASDGSFSVTNTRTSATKNYPAK